MCRDPGCGGPKLLGHLSSGDNPAMGRPELWDGGTPSHGGHPNLVGTWAMGRPETWGAPERQHPAVEELGGGHGAEMGSGSRCRCLSQHNPAPCCPAAAPSRLSH